ncbi:nucleotidyltransferase family protein [Dactylococcopsis salina]|uniref:Nucleotidyltransferase n=1 Tax=Dactylococcopsis salina (strain PCC 8305) TaxID=13035 RepID=K9YUK5_DACS8|nr:nucleotidyltransferase family protein [Dactylococcopsis salina]AFZ50584.1 putative nucleotidyltransferase [Dactylococcopsis salina PCC 8305]
MNREVVLSTLNEHLKEINQFGVKSLALFGSIARNEATPDSDLDFLVEFKGAATLDGYMGLKFLLEDLFDKEVDLVIKADLKPQIRENVINEAIHVTSP